MASGSKTGGSQQPDLCPDEGVKTQVKLERLNQSTLRDMEKIVKGNPPGADLWPFFRKANANYKATRNKLAAQPKPSGEVKEPIPSQQSHLQHAVPSEGDISVLWPLASNIALILCDPSPPSSGETEKEKTRETSISRSALSGILRQGDILYQYFSRAVVRVAPDIVVKINKSRDVTELANLHHILSASQTIPVPAPLGMIAISHFCYHFTSFLPGTPLDRIWGNLTTWQKEDVRGQLNRLFIELRKLPLPSKEGYLGAGNPPTCKDHRRWTKTSTSPILDETQFNAFLLSEPCSSESFINYLHISLPSDHRIVMTHGDLHPRNILVDAEQSVRIMGIVDWEFGGAYPEYWEYVQALKSSFTAKDDDWHAFLPEGGIGKYFDEFARDGVISRMAS
ncbi:hypothetical protein FQN54_005016 [Arachnomyces sp. PD_36]|nr:hypothetical protein FQN54_005016 [Arachnomyces sp. PD_36]